MGTGLLNTILAVIVSVCLLSATTDAARSLLQTSCPSGTVRWPQNSNYCWLKRSSGGQKQGPGNNIFSPTNVVLNTTSDQLELRVTKTTSGKTACAEVYLDRSLGYGDYVWEVDKAPNAIHQNLVGATFMYADSNAMEYDIVFARYGNTAANNVIYNVNAVASTSVRVTSLVGRITHRLRWASASAQVHFESWAADGTLITSWNSAGADKMVPGTERARANFWIYNPTGIPSSSKFILNCFSYCAAGQEATCSTPMGQKPRCSGSAAQPSPSPQPASPSPQPASPSPQPASPSPAPPAQPPCPSGQFRWPLSSPYCWYRRDTGGARQGPGNNIFRPGNVLLNNSTDTLALQVLQESANTWSCGEVFLNRSLGLGDYVFVVQTDPSLIHHNLVGSPFLYANDANEFDVVEYSRWGDPAIDNSQYVVQPYSNAGATQRFNLSGTTFTHRLRWSGTSTPQQVLFETYASNGALVMSWTGAGGNNFIPGDERVHINHWIFSTAGGLPANSQLIVNCFKFCPLGYEASCSTPFGTQPTC